MTKAEALHSFWNSFGIPAWSRETVPDNRPSRYITYEVATDSLDRPVPMSADIWDIGTTKWEWISGIAEQISDSLVQVKSIPLDTGYLYITRGQPFAQREEDDDDTVRRIYINIMAEYLAP